MDRSPKNNRGAPHPGPIKLEVLKRCRPTDSFVRMRQASHVTVQNVYLVNQSARQNFTTVTNSKIIGL